jgi:plasmid stabilization system protein ParE
MRLILHKKVYSDITAIMDHYKRTDTPELANDFYREFRHFAEEAADRPEAFAVRERDIRRVNFKRFPYHFLFRIVDDCIRILVVRHHSRNPRLGMRRR